MMDDKGRLHMPGFVGETFEETGVDKEIKALPVLNRKERRRLEALEREKEAMLKSAGQLRGS